MDINQMAQALEEARITLARADRVAGQLANMLRGRLRSGNIPSYVLKDLKKELANYNMHTGEWKP